MTDTAQDLERQQQAEQAEYNRVAAEIAELYSRISAAVVEQEARRLRIAAIARRRMDWWER